MNPNFYESSEIERAAEVLMVLNPLGHPDVESKIRHIKWHIDEALGEGAHTYVSTGGWIAHTFPHCGDHNDIRVKVSLTPYTVGHYLKTMGVIV